MVAQQIDAAHILHPDHIRNGLKHAEQLRPHGIDGFLRLFSLGNVTRKCEERGDRRIGARPFGDGEFEPSGLAVWQGDPNASAIGNTLFAGSRESLHRDGRLVRRENLVDRLAEQHLLLLSQKFWVSCPDLKVAAVLVHLEEDIGNGGDDPLCEFKRFLELPLGLLVLCNVHDGADHPGRIAVVPGEHRLVDDDIPHRLARGSHLLLEASASAPFEKSLIPRELEFSRVLRIEIELGFPDDLLAPVAKQVFESLVAAGVAPLGVLIENRQGKCAEQRFEKGFPVDGGVLMLRSVSPLLVPFREKGRLPKRLRQRHHGSSSPWATECIIHPVENSSKKAAQVI
ncbi:hypothetical protein FHT69_005736 [Rhizobium sp. BK008]|nr:hypothetical protein [Rhizobium sp. BK008]